MRFDPACRALTAVPLYFVAITSLGAEELPTSLVEKLLEPKDWIVGFIVGVIGGLAALLLLSFRVPKLKISRDIVKVMKRPRVQDPIDATTEPKKEADERLVYTIKVINKRRHWWFVDGHAIDVRVELHLVKKDIRGAETVIPIQLVRHDPLIIPHKRRHLPGSSEYIFDVADKQQATTGSPEPSVLERELIAGIAIRFRIYAKDSFSNYGKIFTQYYYQNHIKRGAWEPGSLDVVPDAGLK